MIFLLLGYLAFFIFMGLSIWGGVLKRRREALPPPPPPEWGPELSSGIRYECERRAHGGAWSDRSDR